MKRLIFCFALLFLLLGCSEKVPARQLDLYAFSVGKADALLIKSDDAAIMIDTGEHKDGDRLVARLHALGVEKLDLLILTHFDKDHIGGADMIIRYMPIDRIVLPRYDKESKQYSQLLNELRAATAEIVDLTQDASLQYGDMQVFIWPSPVPFDGESDNTQSLITKILYDGKTYLFMGDAEKDELKKLIYSGRNLTCDVLKLPHHGVIDDNTFMLMTTALPSYVIICDSEKNPADEVTIRTLETFDPVILQTKNGTIHLIASNGKFTVE